MRFLSLTVGGLLGAIPGLLLIAIGQIVTDGGDGMISFGLGGVVLTFGGLIVGAALGWKRSSWLSGHRGLGAVIGLVAVFLVAALSVLAVGSPGDPIMGARDCRELYEALGATGPQGELLNLPELSGEELQVARAKVVELEAKAAEYEPDYREADLAICAKFTEELRVQTGS